ncbi:aspartate/glutamate racemase family protein [Candidatus Saccharibacteria bacterium]|nr:aspartate/glutamate racemase family protein [Candidatus Saccharibacteria bacterium]
MQHILIIGGMGPQASVYAHKRILDIAHERYALHNNDYPRITHLSVNVPDFIADDTRKFEALFQLKDAISEISVESVSEGFIACNTAHMLYDDLAKLVGREKLYSIVDETSRHIETLRTPSVKIGLLATPSTIQAELYKVDILPTPEQQDVIESCIRGLISNESPRKLYRRLLPVLDDFQRKGATHILLGCTELSILYDILASRYHLIDPVDIIIRKIMRL